MALSTQTRKRSIVAAALHLSLLVGFSLGGQSETPLDVRTVLERAAAQYAQRSSVMYDSETVITWPGKEFKPGERTGLRYLCRFVEDGERIDLTTRLLETVDGEERPFKDSRRIWDGAMFLLRTRLPEMDHHNAYVSKDRSLRAAVMQSDRKDTFLDGCLPGFGGDHYAKVLLESADLNLRAQMEEIDGCPCYVVEASRRQGESCAFWIDPAAGYSLRQAVVRRELMEEPPESPPGVVVAAVARSSEFSVRDVQLELLDGRWFPLAGVAEDRMVYTDGRSHHSKSDVYRRSVVWNPDLKEVGAFQMDLPEGAKVSDQDDPLATYVWHDGRLADVRQMHGELVGRPAPPLVVEQWYNADFWRLNFADKVVVLDFFGVWCSPCMAQVPLLKDLWEQHHEQGLVVIGVHTPREKEGISDFITRDRVSYPIAVDHEGETAKQYGVYFYPTVVIIDRTGRIHSVNPEKDQLPGLLTALLK